jgi:hypothetical protein
MPLTKRKSNFLDDKKKIQKSKKENFKNSPADKIQRQSPKKIHDRLQAVRELITKNSSKI